jgi:hypothetical protein
VRVGALNASAVPHALEPDLVGRLVTSLGGRFPFRSVLGDGGPQGQLELSMRRWADGGAPTSVTNVASGDGLSAFPKRRRPSEGFRAPIHPSAYKGLSRNFAPREI